MKPTRRSPWLKAVAWVTLIAFATASAGCADEEPGGAAPPRDDVRFAVTPPDGETQRHTAPGDEVALALLRDVAAFEADGRTTTDPAALLTASRVVLHGARGDVAIVREPDGLRVAAASGEVPPIAVRAEVAAGRLLVSGPDGVTTVDLDGLEGDERARALGSLTIALLVPDDPSVMHGEVRDYAAIVIVIGIVFASWVACVTIGTYICGQSCATTCANSGGVKQYRMICGYSTAGYPGDCTCECNGNET